MEMVLLAFSVVSPDSLENIKCKWVPEIQHFSPKTPFVLLGLKHDQRGAVENQENGIPVQKALQVARDIGNFL